MSIHIKKANRGKFSASAKNAGMSTQQYARHILANKDNYSATQVKRANFARNASKWHHYADGGIVDDYELYDIPIATSIPSYAFGLDKLFNFMNTNSDKITAGTSALGDTTQAISGTADSKAAVAGSTLSGMGKGVEMGAVAGPWGMLVGGVAGGLGGLFTGRHRRRELQRLRRRNNTKQMTQQGMQVQADAENNYWDDNIGAYTFADGGIVPDNLAYVDNNELLRDYNGNITQVPNTTKGTDQHLIDATTLESVLSDKIKRPGTNRTFAQEGKQLAKFTKESPGNDEYAQNTNKLNKMNANYLYNQLLMEQEGVKARRGIGRKVKRIPAYADGGPAWRDINAHDSRYINRWLTNAYNYIKNNIVGKPTVRRQRSSVAEATQRLAAQKAAQQAAAQPFVTETYNHPYREQQYTNRAYLDGDEGNFYDIVQIEAATQQAAQWLAAQKAAQQATQQAAQQAAAQKAAQRLAAQKEEVNFYTRAVNTPDMYGVSRVNPNLAFSGDDVRNAMIMPEQTQKPRRRFGRRFANLFRRRQNRR